MIGVVVGIVVGMLLVACFIALSGAGRFGP